jgi:uncharacterized SAM-binding protein YcdF (DUF218 family)
MMLQQALTALVLPPLGLVLACLLGGLLAWQTRSHVTARRGALLAILAALGLLLLSTPLVAGLLMNSLEREVTLVAADAASAAAAQAIVILGAELAPGAREPDIGPMTLERLRAGAALHRRTGLPVLVTGGVLSRGTPPIAELMARSLKQDFGVEPRWVENRAPDTRGNAVLSADMLKAEGIGTAFVVTHAWHLPRALEAFRRTGLEPVAAPVHQPGQPEPTWSDWMPRPDHLAESWFALREWAGRVVYALRD